MNQMANGRPILTGWPLIEEWMTTLDKGMVSDFNDDINTLLTFVRISSVIFYWRSAERVDRQVCSRPYWPASWFNST